MNLRLKRILGFAAVFVTFAECRAAAQSAHYYVPLAFAIIGFSSPPLSIRTEWSSDLSVFNAGQTLATVEPVAIYGDMSLLEGQLPYQLPPSTGQSIFRLPFAAFIDPSSPGPLGFAELVADPSIVLNAGIERVQIDCGCFNPGSINCSVVSQGRAPIPVFHGLFPAGGTVVCGDVNLGAPDQNCGDPPGQQDLRRVNVTLFNGGDEPATFAITAIPLSNTAQPLFQESVTLAPKEVRQLNRVAIPVVSSVATRSGVDIFVWITISATQPFLAYVSSVFEGGTPGSLPFEVFPPRLAASTP